MKLLRWCIVKIKVLRCVVGMAGKGVHMAMVPLMSRSVYTHMAKCLEVINNSPKEVQHPSI